MKLHTILIATLLLAVACTQALARQGTAAPPPPTQEQKAQEKSLLARISKKQGDSQGFYQHWLAYHRAGKDGDPAAVAYKQDAERAMQERNEAEMTLVQLFFDEGRDREAVSRLQVLAKLGVRQAVSMLDDIEFAEARRLYQEYLDTKNEGKRKASLDRLWDLHRRGYSPATEALKGLDIL